MTRAARAGRVLLRPRPPSWPRCRTRGRWRRTWTRCSRSCRRTMRRRRPMTRRYDDTLRDRHLRARAAVLATLTGASGCFRAIRHRTRELPRHARAGAALDRRADVRTAHGRRRRARRGQRQRALSASSTWCSWPGSSRASGRSRRAATSSTRQAVLRELGWPGEQARLHGARAAFGDLVALPAQRLMASALSPRGRYARQPLAVRRGPGRRETARASRSRSSRAGSSTTRRWPPARRVPDALDERAAAWAALRIEAPAGEGVRYRGARPALATRPRCRSAPSSGISIAPSSSSPPMCCGWRNRPRTTRRSRRAPGAGSSTRRCSTSSRPGIGRAPGPITPENLARARAVFAAAVEPLLARLSDTDAAHERARLFGSAISPGVAETVLSLEASRRSGTGHRALAGISPRRRFHAGRRGATRSRLRGMADRIDLLPGRRLRVIDYKSGQRAAAQAGAAGPRVRAVRAGAPVEPGRRGLVGGRSRLRELARPAHAGAYRQGRFPATTSGWPKRAPACWRCWPTWARASSRRGRRTR